MSMTYTWEITSLKTKTEGSNTSAVIQTYWKKTGTDENGRSGIFDGATPLTSANVPEGEFIPFEELTEEIVLGWIQSQIDEFYENHINAQIQKQIDKFYVTQPGLPWDPTKGLPPNPDTIPKDLSDSNPTV
jgi:hypothetical protein